MTATHQRQPAALRSAFITLAFFVVRAGVPVAHDVFLKATRYFPPENSEVRMRVRHGTFTRSERSIATTEWSGARHAETQYASGLHGAGAAYGTLGRAPVKRLRAAGAAACA